MTILEDKTAAVATAETAADAARTGIDKHTVLKRTRQGAVAREQAKLAALEARDPALHATWATAVRQLAEAKEALLKQLVLEVSGLTIRLDPVEHDVTIQTVVSVLRNATRSELDTPGNLRYVVHPLVARALSLVPPPDWLNTPGNILRGETGDWATRRERLIPELSQHLAELTQLLAENTAPLEAA